MAMMNINAAAGAMVAGFIEIAETRALRLKTPAPRQFFNRLIDETWLLEYCLTTTSGMIASNAFAFGSSVGAAISNTILKLLPLTAFLVSLVIKASGLMYPSTLIDKQQLTASTATSIAPCDKLEETMIDFYGHLTTLHRLALPFGFFWLQR